MSDWHEKYKVRYAALKKSGRSFFPYIIFKDVVVAVVIGIALLACAIHWGAGLEPVADPTDSSYNPRPEWYFLSLFQALKYFPGSLEAVASVFLPTLFFVFLIALPLLDRGPDRHPLDRPWLTGIGVLGIAVLSYLTWAGYNSPLTNPIVEKDPLVMEGQRLYRDMKCAYCHSIQGVGGTFAPDLSLSAAQRNDAWLTAHFRDPQSVTPGSQMPKLNLLDDEIRSLVAFIHSLDQTPPRFSPEAPRLFAENCSVCHKIQEEGGDIGPDLSTIGVGRDVRYLQHYITDSGRMNPRSQMPKFAEQLTETEILDLARYLAAQRPPKETHHPKELHHD